MTDAPERIWRWAVGNTGWIEYSETHPITGPNCNEYIRKDKDTIAAMVAEARNAALEEAAAYCEAIEMGISPKAGGKYTPHPSTCFEVGSGTHAGMGYAAAIRAIKDAAP